MWCNFVHKAPGIEVELDNGNRMLIGDCGPEGGDSPYSEYEVINSCAVVVRWRNVWDRGIE